MALETLKTPESIKDNLSDLKNEVKGENMKKIWLILDELNASKEDVSKQNEIMKSLLFKTNKAWDLLARKLAQDLSGKNYTEGVTFGEFMAKQHLDEDAAMNKNFADMTSEDKVNVLFSVFGEALIGRLGQEKVDLTTISEEKFNEVYKNIFKKMSDIFVKVNESVNKAE